MKSQPKPVKITIWFNVYKHGRTGSFFSHQTRRGADDAVITTNNIKNGRIACIKRTITFKVGEGLCK